MAKAKKLPSGNWRIRVGAGKDGKSKSFTAPTKKEAELMAAEWLNGQRRDQTEQTVAESVTAYIDAKRHVLSPTTIAGYEKILRCNLSDISHIRLCDLTQDTIQRFVNRLALGHSAKTVHNAYGLLSSVLSTYAPELHFRISLPKKQKTFRDFPKVDEILTAFRGHPIEIPVLLALWEGMRMSEIRGAKKSDIRDGILTIHSVIVTADGVDIEKEATKTFDSARRLRLPQYILDLVAAIPPEQEYLTTLSGQAIYKAFCRQMEKCGLQKIRFHDLRHLNASIMLALGIPEKYALERGGWSNPTVLRSVYQHTFSDERNRVDEAINDYFSALIDTEIATESEKSQNTNG